MVRQYLHLFSADIIYTNEIFFMQREENTLLCIWVVSSRNEKIDDDNTTRFNKEDRSDDLSLLSLQYYTY